MARPSSMRQPASALVLGSPGILPSWGFSAIRNGLLRSAPDITTVDANTRDELDAIYDGESRFAVFSQYPNPDLVETVCSLETPVLLLAESSYDSFAYLADTCPQPEMALVRILSASHACIASVRATHRIHVFHRDRIGSLGAAMVVSALCSLIDGPPATGERADIGPGLLPPEAALDTVEDALRQVAGYAPPLAVAESQPCHSSPAGMIGIFNQWIRYRDAEKTVWPRESFLLGDRPDTFVTSDISLAGPARCLVYGPYLHLPAGSWLARLKIGFAEHMGGQSFIVEFASGSVLARRRIAPSRPGRFEGDIPLFINQPQTAIEIRVLMESGAIEGSITQICVEFSRWEAAIVE